MPLGNNIFFSSLALDQAYLHPGGTVAVNNNIEVSAEPPVVLDDVWCRWLGTIQADKFRQSGLFITAQRPVPVVGAHVPGRLEQPVRLFHFCLLLQGCAFSPGGMMVG